MGGLLRSLSSLKFGTVRYKSVFPPKSSNDYLNCLIIDPSFFYSSVIMAPSATEGLSTSKPIYRSGDPSLTIPEDVPKGPPSFDDKYEERKYLKHRLALAFRIFAKFGFCEGVSGHITLRDPVHPQNFWVNPFGRHLPSLPFHVKIRH